MVETKTIAQQLGITKFPFEIFDENNNRIYYEESEGFWYKCEFDSKGNKLYWENSDGEWCKFEYDSEGNKIYTENSDGFWEKMEYDSNGNEIYYENSNRNWARREFDSNGKMIYYEDSDGYIEDYRNVPEESPEEAFHRLIKDNVVLEFRREFGLASSVDTTKIVLNGRIMTAEYYSELINVINKLQGSTNYTVTIF